MKNGKVLQTHNHANIASALLYANRTAKNPKTHKRKRTAKFKKKRKGIGQSKTVKYSLNRKNLNIKTV